LDGVQNSFGVRQSTYACRPTCHEAVFGADALPALFFQGLDIFLYDGIIPHLRIHGGAEESGAGRWKRKSTRADDVVAEALGQFSDDVGGGGKNHKEIGFSGRIEVRVEISVVYGRRCGPEFSAHFFLGEGGKGEWGNKLACSRGHRHLNVVSGLFECADDICGFIRGNSTRYTYEDFFHETGGWAFEMVGDLNIEYWKLNIEN